MSLPGVPALSMGVRERTSGGKSGHKCKGNEKRWKRDDHHPRLHSMSPRELARLNLGCQKKKKNVFYCLDHELNYSHHYPHRKSNNITGNNSTTGSQVWKAPVFALNWQLLSHVASGTLHLPLPFFSPDLCTDGDTKWFTTRLKHLNLGKPSWTT